MNNNPLLEESFHGKQMTGSSRHNFSPGTRRASRAILIFSLPVFPCPRRSATGEGATSVQAFLGRWDLTLKTPGRESPSWLEITQEDGQLKARMVSRWGHARPLPKVEISNGQITFVSPKEEEDRKDDMVFTGKLSGKMLLAPPPVPTELPGNGQACERHPSRERALLSGASRRSCSTART